MEAVASQPAVVPGVSADVTPVAGGTSMTALPSAMKELARFFLNLSGSSSLGASGDSAGVTASGAALGDLAGPSSSASGAATFCGTAAPPAGAGVLPDASDALPSVSGERRRRVRSRSRDRRSRSSSDRTGFYSRLFLVEKATGGWRPVIDLSHLNDFVQLTPFKMETVASVLLSVREGDFLASLDLKDAYFQIPIHGSSRKLLRFMSEGTVYQFKALCFGLSTAPQVFTRVFAAVSAWAHARGIRLLRYLDDWLVLSSSEKKAKESIRELLSLCRTLGIVINEKKSDLVPSQSAKYLGMTIDTGAGKVFPSLARVEKFLAVAERFCSMQSPPAQLWQVILGHLASLERLVPHGRLRMRSLQWHLKSQWSPESDPPSLPVALPEEARRDLSWWMVRDHLLVGVRFGTPAPDLHLYSDASSSGWGAHLLDQNVSGVLSAQEKLLHINLLEMKALFLALQAFQEDVAGHHVTAMCDNSTVVAYVNKTGGHGVEASVFVDQPPSEMDGVFRRPSRSEVSSRRVQRPGRCTQPSRASCGDRVVSPPSGGESTSSYAWQSVDRPVRDLPQREAAPILLACPGSTGRLRGCVSSSLGRPGSLRVPSLCSGRSGDRSRPAVIASRDDSGRTSLAREGVVRRLAASTDPTTPGSTLLGQAALAAPLQPVPSRRPRAEPSRVATLKRHYRKSGFSGRAARVLSGVLRESSSRLYQSRWKIFCGWCRGRSVAPVNASVPVVVDFLIHLRQDKGLSVSAVKGYCSALNSVLALKGRDLAASREITTLLRSFARSVNPVELRPPAWDVSLVLQSLTGAPYEPLRTCEERFLAQKTLFLLALASAKRIGELHALSYRVSHTRDWGEVSFAFVTGFVAKTQDPSSLAPRFEGFTVPALTNARKNRNGRLLCPVRAVKVYLDRTAPHRPRCERLFVTAGRSKKEISKTTVSFWLRKTISRAYELSGTALPVPAPRARETSGIAPSILFRKNFAVDQVLKAGTWRRHTTFTRHYLRDIAHKSLDTFHLGPVVAAQSVV